MNLITSSHAGEYKIFNLTEVQEFIKHIPVKKSVISISNKGPFTKFWYSIDWKQLELELLRMQHKIFSSHNDCRQLQDQVVNSPINKLLAVKKVAFTNLGRTTTAINGLKKLSHQGGILLASRLCIDGKARSIRRVWIAKSKTIEKRPLGISIIRDRAKQVLLKAAIEPQWEAKFSSRVFGFRPGRRCHDALWNIRNSIRKGSRYIYYADLEKCFDNISHNYLIEKLGFDEKDIFTLQIRSWLTAGILDPKEKESLFPKMGTVEGGVISPLLCNIALHGMESHIIKYLINKGVRTKYILEIKLYTYADDFLLISDNKRTLFLAINAINEFLVSIGFDIKKSKTKKIHTINRAISHTIDLISHIDENGKYHFDPDKIYLPVPYGKKVILLKSNEFNFLGFTFRCFSVGKHKSTKIRGNKLAPLIVWVLPAPSSIKKHFSVIRSNVRKSRNPIELVKTLSPIIKGWLEYFSKSDLRASGKVGLLRTRMNMILLNWQYKRMRTRKRNSKNWIIIRKDQWRFFADDPKTCKRLILPSHSDSKFSLVSYKPIRGNATPYDCDIAYWAMRNKSVLGLSTLLTKVLAEQRAKCIKCSQQFNIFDDITVIRNPDQKRSVKKNKHLEYRIVHKECNS